MYASGRKEPQRAVEGEVAQPLRILPSRRKKERAGSQDNVPPRDIVNEPSRQSTIEECGERNRGYTTEFQKQEVRPWRGWEGSQESNVEKINSDEREKGMNKKPNVTNEPSESCCAMGGNERKYESTFDDSASMMGGEGRDQRSEWR